MLARWEGALVTAEQTLEDKIAEVADAKWETLLSKCRQAGRTFNWKTRYIKQEVIAHNMPQFCKVFACALAADPDRSVILKVKMLDPSMDKRGMLRWNARELFMMEIVATSSHPNIVNLQHGVITGHDEVFMEMEYCDGTLASHADRFQGSPPLDFVKRITRDLLSGLAFCHAKNVVHGDIKADNLFMSKGTLKIADFGAATQVSANGFSLKPDYNINSTGYKPIEIIALYAYSPATDIWAAACTIIGLFGADRTPFVGRTPDEILNIINFVSGPIEDGYYLIGANKALALATTTPQPFHVTFSHIPACMHTLLRAMLRLDQFERPPAAVLLWDVFLNCSFWEKEPKSSF